MNNVAVYIATPSEGMEKVMIDICPPEIDLRFLHPTNGKPGRIEDADILLVNAVKVTREMIERAPNLRHIQTCSAGYNNVDLDAAREHGITVANCAGENATTTAEMAIALMLAVYRRICQVDKLVKQGEWHQFTWRHDSYELRGKTIGLIGAGACGRAVMQRLSGWEVRIIYSDPYRMKPEMEEALGAEYVDMDTLFKEADVVSLHCPLTDSTRGMVNRRTLGLMKKTAIIINEARGAVINEPDLIEALQNGTIWGAGLDCWEKEPIDPGNPLLKMDKVVTTSHLGGSTYDALCRMMETAYGNVLHLLHGEPLINVVS